MDLSHIRNFSIIAHIDHGKSTLADRLLEYTGTITERERTEQILDSMDLERERGITIKASAVRLRYRARDGEEYMLNLIDTPGHVDFTYEVSRSLAACEGALLVVDAVQGVEAQTVANVYLALDNNLEILPVLNKIDLPAAEPDRVKSEIEDIIGLDTRPRGARLSAKEGRGTQDVLEGIVQHVPAPQGDATEPLRALMFDSWFDPYSGVIMVVRVFDGVVRKGSRVLLMAAGKSFEVLRVGVFAPRLQEIECLGPGEVGCIMAGIKDVHETKIGDTITDAATPTLRPLPGFKAVKPMVFSGLYPADTSQYPVLRDAVEKLRLNDASFTYEPENSMALGFGFRCGFLGLLHMEIIGERLEREFGLSLITTAPTVAYRVTTLRGEVLMVDSPAKLPPVQSIAGIEEPIILATVHVPETYLGGVLKLCEEKRGRQRELKFLGRGRMMVTYELPLNEVVLDFYDRLKSVSKGYASLDYEFIAMQPSRPRQARHQDQRRAGRRVVADRAPGPCLSARPRAGGEDEGTHPAPDVRGGHPGGDRDQGDRARNRQGAAQERHRQVLRRRHLAQAEVAGAAEGRQEAHEAGRARRDPAGSVPRRIEGGGVRPGRPRPPGCERRSEEDCMRKVGWCAVLLVLGSPVWAQAPLFRQAARYSLPGSATDTAYVDALVAADIGSPDGPPDGIADVVSANVNQLAPVLFGTPEGTFTTGPNAELGVVPTALALADLTGDARPDLVVGDSLNIRVLRGLGDGSFGVPGPDVPAGLGVTALAITDLNGDGKADVIAVDDGDQLARAGAVTILLGRGDGSFVSPPNTLSTGTGSSGVALGDYNRDGKIDLAVSNAGDNTVSILLGDGLGGFASGQTAAAGDEPAGIASGELTGDGRLDLVVVNRNTDTVSVLDGIGDGGFRAPRSFVSGSAGSEPTTVDVADVSGDGKLDVIVSNKRSSDASVLLGNGRGSLARPRTFVADQEPRALLVRDVTGDALPDLVTVNQGTDTPNLAVLPGLGDGAFGAVEDVMTQPQPSTVVTGDADNNGLTDLIVSQLPSQASGAGSLRIMLAQSDGSFGPPSTLASTGDAIAAVAADFNVDGVLDVGAVNRSTNNVSVFLGRPLGDMRAVPELHHRRGCDGGDRDGPQRGWPPGSGREPADQRRRWGRRAAGAGGRDIRRRALDHGGRGTGGAGRRRLQRRRKTRSRRRQQRDPTTCRSFLATEMERSGPRPRFPAAAGRGR